MKLLKKHLKALISTGIAAFTIASVTSCGSSKYKLLWSDEFDGEELDKTIWNREIRNSHWTNNELQAYTDDVKNGFIRDGKFVIKAYPHESIKNEYTSCKLNTRMKKDFLYGKVCVSAKVPKGKGLWPAIWMMPQNESVYGQWPKCGEIDIMEVLGDNTKKAYGTLHYGEPHAEQQSSYVLETGDFSTEFHEYSIEWEPGEIKWYIDGNLYQTANDWFSAAGSDEKPYPAPFDQLFTLQINLAVGGDWPGNPEWGADYIKDAEFEIDYVRVYQRGKYNTKVSKPEKDWRSPDSTGNYITNMNFTENEDLNDTKGWQFLQAAGGVGTCTLANNMATVATTASGNQDYSIQFLHNEMPFKKGKTYKVTFDAWADEARTLNEVCVSAPNAGWIRYWTVKDLAITTEKKTYTYEFTMNNKDDNAARLEFNFGNNSSMATVHFTNVSVKEA